MRNGQITVKGAWKRPFNILSANSGDYVVSNYKNWYSNTEGYWTLLKDQDERYTIISYIPLETGNDM